MSSPRPTEFSTGDSSIDSELVRLAEILSRDDLSTLSERSQAELAKLFPPRTLLLAISLGDGQVPDSLKEAVREDSLTQIESVAKQVRVSLSEFLGSEQAKALVASIPPPEPDELDEMFPQISSGSGTGLLWGRGMEPRLRLRAYDIEGGDLIDGCYTWDDILFLTHVACSGILAEMGRLAPLKGNLAVNVENVEKWLEETQTSLDGIRENIRGFKND